MAYRGDVRRLGFLLRPGWLVLALVVVAFAYACFTLLAPWQLGKNSATTQRNALISDSFTSPPTELTNLVPAGQAPAPGQEWRLVTVTGTYQQADEVLARLRSVEGKAAYEVLTPLRTTQGETVLVDRGYVRPVVGTDAPPVDAAPTGQVSLQARIRLDEPVDRGRPAPRVAGPPQVYVVNSGAVAAITATTISPGYLQLADGQPGVLGPLPLPLLEPGPYLSYGLQWLAFGLMAPLGLAYFVRAELRERRREKDGREATANDLPPAEPGLAPAAGAGSGIPCAHASTAPAAAPSGQTLLADRYGKRR